MKIRFWKKVPKGAFLLSIIYTLNVIFGFLRESVSAYYFGTSPEFEEFLVGLTLPNLIVTNIAQVSVAVVLPLYIGYQRTDRPELATALVRRWFWYSGLFVLAIIGVLFVSADYLVRLIAPGFTSVKVSGAADWMRMLLPFVFLYGLSGVFKAILNSRSKFYVAAMSGLALSFVVVLFCIGGNYIHNTVANLALGYIAGGGIVFLWQLKRVLIFEPLLGNINETKNIVALPVAATIAMLANSVLRQLDVVVDRVFLSGLSEGSIAAYHYANMIKAVPAVVITSALTTSLFPVIARMTSDGMWKQAYRSVRKWSTILLLVGIVPALLLIFLREQVVEIVFKRGEFGDQAATMTAEVLKIIPLIILVNMASPLYTQLLLAQKKTRTVAALAALSVVLKVILCMNLVSEWELEGLAVSSLVALLITFAVRVAIVQSAIRREYSIDPQ